MMIIFAKNNGLKSVLLAVIFSVIFIFPLQAAEKTTNKKSIPMYKVQFNEIVEKARNKHLELKLADVRERHVMEALMRQSNINTEKVGESYGRILEIKLKYLEILVDVSKAWEDYLFKTENICNDNRCLNMNILMVAPPKGQWLPGPGGNPWGGGGKVACEDVSEESKTMKYVCSTTVNFDWIITWKKGGYSKFSNDLDLPLQ